MTFLTWCPPTNATDRFPSQNCHAGEERIGTDDIEIAGGYAGHGRFCLHWLRILPCGPTALITQIPQLPDYNQAMNHRAHHHPTPRFLGHPKRPEAAAQPRRYPPPPPGSSQDLEVGGISALPLIKARRRAQSGFFWTFDNPRRGTPCPQLHACATADSNFRT